MSRFTRRSALTASALPLSAALLPWVATAPAHAQGNRAARGPASSGDDIWQAGARPDFTLAVEQREIAPFGTAIQALLVGGTWPGPTIRYRKGDQFRVLVENRLDQPTTLHWHGLIVPTLEDGVPGISQAPIPPGAVYYYAFPLQQSGTYWYHSHFGLQEQQGLSGPLIIDDPDEPHDYDEDVVVFLSDVVDGPVDRVIPKLRNGSLMADVADPYLPPDGAPFPIDVPYAGYLVNGRPPDAPWTQALRPGSPARLRLINGSGSSYFRIAIDGVPLEVIACDGEAVVPVTVDNLVLGTGQRCDVIVTLAESGSYTLRAAALGDDKQALAALHTPDVPPKVESRRARFPGRALRESDLSAPRSTVIADRPRKTFTVTLAGQMQNYLWTMNDKLWPEPYATFAGSRPEESFYRIQPGDMVRFDLVNRTPMVHPMHLHGHVFRVLEDGQDRPDAPIRDTVTVWPKRKVSIEFVANNPGRWFFHCHNIWHLATGMAQAVIYEAPTA